jgi:hypothetical protein
MELAEEIPLNYAGAAVDFWDIFSSATISARPGVCVFSRPHESDETFRELREKLRRDSSDSFRLLENFRDNPVCSILQDEANHCIMVIWKQHATHIQFRYIHEKLLSLICEHGVDKILGDDTALPAIPSEDRFWVIDEWFPRAVQCGLRFAASKSPDSHFGKLAVTHIQSAAPASLKCRSFERLEEARAWLDTVTAA